jgi:hypothetical protein
MDERWPGSPPSPCLDQAILMLPGMAGAVKRSMRRRATAASTLWRWKRRARRRGPISVSGRGGGRLRIPGASAR